MNKTYVLSDLHGNYKILLEMLKCIHFDHQDTLYILGDCCDRGPKSLEIYDFISKQENIILIKGNHEIMMRNAFLDQDNPNSSSIRLWSQNGGLKTYRSYHNYLQKQKFKDCDYQIVKSAFYKMMIEYIESCPNFVEVTCNGKEYVLVHAGINPEKGLYEQTEEECAWIREWFFLSKGIEGKMIIFGHTPTSYLYGDTNKHYIWIDPIYGDKIGIDGGLGSYLNGQLNCLCLDTLETYIIKKQDALD